MLQDLHTHKHTRARGIRLSKVETQVRWGRKSSPFARVKNISPHLARDSLFCPGAAFCWRTKLVRHERTWSANKFDADFAAGRTTNIGRAHQMIWRRPGREGGGARLVLCCLRVWLLLWWRWWWDNSGGGAVSRGKGILERALPGAR